jgi:O-antigen/teichoic acid export membrane protein
VRLRLESTAFLRMIGSAITVQALLSAASFLVGIILIRYNTGTEYGYYVLVTNAVLLMTILQNAFIQPQLVPRLAVADDQGRADLIGGVLRDQRWIWPLPALVCMVIAIALRLTGQIGNEMLLLLFAAGGALYASLFREFFRMMLLGRRRPEDVLKSDLLFIVLSIAGALIATRTGMPAFWAVISLAFAAFVGGVSAFRILASVETWNIHGAPGILLALIPLGMWSAAGAVIHWLFSQGYNYVVAATLDVKAVSEIATTRLLIMPMNLLSTGIGTMMLPTVAEWLSKHSVRKILRRVILFTLGMALIAMFYSGVIWLLRDWLFTHVFKKSFPDRDMLLVLWLVVGLFMLFRDQMIYLLVVRGRFKFLTWLTLGSALLGLTLSYVEMRQHGAAGALIGVLCGEVVNVAGIFVLSWRETRLPDA